jgi:hypothetical protein
LLEIVQRKRRNRATEKLIQLPLREPEIVHWPRPDKATLMKKAGLGSLAAARYCIEAYVGVCRALDEAGRPAADPKPEAKPKAKAKLVKVAKAKPEAEAAVEPAVEADPAREQAA